MKQFVHSPIVLGGMALALLIVPGSTRARAAQGTGGADAGRKATGTIRGVLRSPYARIASAVVYVEAIDGGRFGPADKNPVMDQANKIFTPHVLPILRGSTVDFPNTDDVRHSVYSREGSANMFNLGQYDSGVVKHVTFENPGVTQLACNVHAEMSAFVLALQNPYFALTDRRGSFEIRDVPAGARKLTFFHEKLRPKTIDVVVEAGKEALVEFTGLTRR